MAERNLAKLIIYYVVLVCILILGALFYRTHNTLSKKVFLWLSFLLLFLLMAVRAETVGRDIHIYREKFQIIAAADTWKDITETVENAPVYGLLCKLVSCFGDYRLMLIVTAFIITGSVAVYIYNFSDNAVISVYCYVALFFYLHTYNISRQFLAIALFLLALCLRNKRKYILCAVCFLLALGIHSLTAIALPLLIINRERITTKKFAVLMVATASAVLVFSVGLSQVVNHFAALFPRYNVYLGGGRHTYTDESSGSIVFLALFYLLVAIMALILQSNLIKGVHIKDEERSRLRWLIIVVTAGALMGIFSGKLEAMARVLYFYQIHAICLIPNAFGKFRRDRAYYPAYFILMLILLVPFTICLTKNFGEVVPYITMW